MLKNRVLPGAMLIALSLFLSGCFLNFGMQFNLKPDDLRHYKIKGALVYGCVETLKDMPSGSTVMLMFKNAPDFNVYIHNPQEYFLIDVPLKCKGIARIGLRYDNQGTMQENWYYNDILFTVQSNKINYLGSIIITNVDITQNRLDKIEFSLTNYMEEDKQDFYSNYTRLAGYEFYPVDIKY